MVAVIAAIAACGPGSASAQDKAPLAAATPGGVRVSDIGSFPDEASARLAWRAAGLKAGVFARATIAGRPVLIAPDGGISAQALLEAPTGSLMSGPRIKSPAEED